MRRINKKGGRGFTHAEWINHHEEIVRRSMSKTGEAEGREKGAGIITNRKQFTSQNIDENKTPKYYEDKNMTLIDQTIETGIKVPLESNQGTRQHDKMRYSNTDPEDGSTNVEMLDQCPDRESSTTQINNKNNLQVEGNINDCTSWSTDS